MSHPEGFKARMVTRMAGPEDISACELSRQVGVSHATLSRTLREERSLRSMATPEKPPIANGLLHDHISPDNYLDFYRIGAA